MVDRATKLRWRRRFRRSKKQVESIGEQAEQQLEEHVLGRLERLWRVRRFLLSWLLLVTFIAVTLVLETRGLSGYYQVQTPVPGGTYTEGIIGTFTTANPLYATGPVDSSVSRLVFNGLFKYNDANALVGDLAQSWTVNARGNVYTVVLKPDLVWQDGKPLTADDVVFTYQTIQNPDADSPLAGSFSSVKVAATDAKTITFTLPSALTSFPYYLTNGIVPAHLLRGVPANQLRSVSFDTAHPVGAGPFSWKTIEVVGTDQDQSREERIALVPNKHYAGGKPKLNGMIIRAFHSESAIVNSFNKSELDGVVGFNKVPDAIKKTGAYREYSFPLTSETMVFFKTSAGVLSDVSVRKALVQGTNTSVVAANLGYPVQTVTQPLLRGMAGYDPALGQLNYSFANANATLDSAGWVKGSNGMRSKNGQPLQFTVTTEDTTEYKAVAQRLQEQWKALGVDVKFVFQSAGDLQTALAFHTYDALLYGISIGVDPDTFAYWHSSQADIRSANRLNFSEYKSATADKALEAARSRSGSNVKSIKYRPFLESWRDDAPALGLYQPRFLYITKQSVAGLVEHTINVPTDRYSNVQNWMIREVLKDQPVAD